MFCPKCGTQNPENGKFCRTCGTDLSPVTDALSGKRNNQNFGMFEPIQPIQPITLNKEGKPVSWETILGTLFTGLAFLAISVILGVTGKANAQKWWFWLLIPAFVMIGSGIAQLIQLKKSEQNPNRKNAAPPDAPEPNKTFAPVSNQSLPPSQTDYVSPAAADSRYKTGDLVPPSVVEATTRHLEINKEGETMTLPKK